MADISAITTTDAVTYTLKDATARSNIKIIGTVTYTVATNTATCDKTYAELNAAISSQEINTPIIKYITHPEYSVSTPDVLYMYLKRIMVSDDYPYYTTLEFYEPGHSGQYARIRSDDSVTRGTFGPIASTPIQKGVITYDSSTDTYSCDKTFTQLSGMAKYYNSYSFVTYQSKIYSMWSFVGNVSSSTATELHYRYINLTTNKIETFTFTQSGSITYSEESLAGGGTVDTVNGISPDTNKNVQVDVELTQAEYDALPSSKLTDDVNYFIKDGGVFPQVSLVNYIYPVGSVYISVNNVSPATLFGGTWEQINDVFLLGAGTTYTAGDTGGESEHTLTVSELPTHSHGVVGGGVAATSTSGGSSYLVAGYTGSANPTNIPFSIADSGDGLAHNNMPPYLVVYMWKRTA